MQRCQVGLETNGFLTVRQGFLRLSAVQEELTEIGSCRSEGGGQFHRLAEMHERLIELAKVAQGETQAIVGLGEVWPLLQGSTQLLSSLGRPAESLEGDAEVRQCLGEIRVQPQSGAATACRSFQLARCPVCLGQVGMESSDVWPQSDGPSHQLHCSCVVSLLLMQHPEQMECIGILLFLRQYLLI